eukprot:1860093-Rhodomonas_salina.1
MFWSEAVCLRLPRRQVGREVRVTDSRVMPQREEPEPTRLLGSLLATTLHSWDWQPDAAAVRQSSRSCGLGCDSSSEGLTSRLAVPGALCAGAARGGPDRPRQSVARPAAHAAPTTQVGAPPSAFCPTVDSPRPSITHASATL